MKRRQFIALGGALLAAPISVSAQTGRKPVVGVLFYTNPEPVVSQLRDALARLGYRDGDTIQLDVRVADGSDARLAEMAAELVARKVDMIIPVTTPAAIAAKAATSSIPIVMGVVADPVGMGLVASLARPGGNITGFSGATAETAGMILGFLREALPSAGRFGVLVNTTDPFHLRLIEGIETANRSVKVDLRIFKVTRPEELEAAFEQMAAQKIDAAIIHPNLPRSAVIALANRHKLPTGSPVSRYAHAGGFLAYSASGAEYFGIIAAQVDQILKGAKPADMPVRQPSKFEMVLNLKTANAFGIAVPSLLLAQADEVIE